MSVKDKKRGRPKAETSQLSAISIIECAKHLMQQDGKIPSIRKLAATLEVDAMAIYHYFANKNTLLEAVTVSLIQAIYEPKSTEHWQQELQRLCKSYLSLLSNHSGLLQTFLSMTTTGPAQVFITRFNIAVAPLQLEPKAQEDALDLLVDFIHGYALAIECNTENTLDMRQLEGPLSLYIRALENS